MDVVVDWWGGRSGMMVAKKGQRVEVVVVQVLGQVFVQSCESALQS